MKGRLQHRGELAALLALALLLPACTGPEAVEANRGQKGVLELGKVTRKRQIAPLFSPENADWLSRPERERTEQPEKVLDALKIPEGATVADVGAGTGYFTWRLAQRVGPKGRVYAVDVQQRMLDMLAGQLKQRNLRNVELVLGGVRDPRLPEGAVDLELLVDVYHEFSEPEAMIGALRRALKPDGRLVLIEYRKEDPDIPILPLHKMSVDEVREEIEPLGFQLSERLNFLPTQHILVFTKRPI
jgi:SAM-dependent methyltransferase